MSFLEAGLAELVRGVVREEVRAALAEHGSGGAEKPATYAQAAKFAEVSTSTIQTWVKTGVLPATGKGKLRRVLLGDVSKALAAMRVAVVPPAQPKSRAAEILSSSGVALRRVRG